MHGEPEAAPVQGVPLAVRCLAVSGSLRAASGNTALVNAAAALAPPGVAVAVYGGLGGLPHFNPDLDDLDGGGPAPAPVRAWRAELRAADAVLISSPEYAHGVPGVLKNALDWVVGSGEFVGKPVALVDTAARATHARAALTEILTTMDARVVPAASVTVPLNGRSLTAAGIAADPALAGPLRAALAALARHAAAVRAAPAPRGPT